MGNKFHVLSSSLGYGWCYYGQYFDKKNLRQRVRCNFFDTMLSKKSMIYDYCSNIN